MIDKEQLLTKNLKYLRELQTQTQQFQTRLHNQHQAYANHIRKSEVLGTLFQQEQINLRNTKDCVFSEQNLKTILNELSQDQKVKLPRELLKYAGIAALVGSLLDLFLVGDGTQAMGKSLFSALGAPDEHLSTSPKVPFDKMLDRSFEATGNHRWNSLSHHPTLVGLFTAISDTLSGTSTHIVDAEVVTVESSNATLEKALKNSPLKNPEAWMIEKVLWSVGTVLAHWWSDVNTSLGLPGPLSTLVKCVEQGEFEYNGHSFNLADLSYELYRDGLDLRRYVADSIVPLSINLVLRWCAWHQALHTGLSKGQSLKAAIHLSDEFRQALLIAHALSVGCNLTKVCLTANPLLINVSQWLSLSRQSLKWILKKQAQHRSRNQEETHESIRENKKLIQQLQKLKAKQRLLQKQVQKSAGRSKN